MMEFTNKIRRWLDPILEDHAVDPEIDQSETLAQWRLAETVSGIKSFGHSVLISGTLAFLGVLLWEPDQLKYVALIVIGSLLTGFAIITGMAHKPSSRLADHAAAIIFGMTVGVTCCISFLMYSCLTDPSSLRSIMVLMGFFWMSSIWSISKICAPLGKPMIINNAIMFTVPSAIFVVFNSSETSGPMFFGFLLVAFVSVFMKLLNKRSEMYAILQTRATKLETRSHALREAAIREDLKIAQMYQENLAQPTVQHLVGDKSIQIESRLAGRFRRDWVGVRVLPGDRYAVAAAVAHESGVLGALAIQTAQSLWMASLLDGNWTPTNWMVSVNHVLRLMGVEGPQTMSVGVLIGGQDEAVYHVAGDLALFISAREPNGKNIRYEFSGNNDPLGRSERLTVQAHRVCLSDSKIERMVLSGDRSISAADGNQVDQLIVAVTPKAVGNGVVLGVTESEGELAS